MSELWRGFAGWPLDAAVLHAGLRAEVPAAAVFASAGVIATVAPDLLAAAVTVI